MSLVLTVVALALLVGFSLLFLALAFDESSGVGGLGIIALSMPLVPVSAVVLALALAARLLGF